MSSEQRVGLVEQILWLFEKLWIHPSITPLVDLSLSAVDDFFNRGTVVHDPLYIFDLAAVFQLESFLKSRKLLILWPILHCRSRLQRSHVPVHAVMQASQEDPVCQHTQTFHFIINGISFADRDAKSLSCADQNIGIDSVCKALGLRGRLSVMQRWKDNKGIDELEG